jgi:hypothetical protein
LVTFFPEGVNKGFSNFAWGFNSKKRAWGEEKTWGTGGNYLEFFV